MSTIYLVATSGKLAKKGETLQLTIDENTTKTIFPFKTDQLLLIGNIDISTPALKFLMHHKIDTVFLNKNGRFNGKLVFRSGKNVFLRQKQYKRLEDETFKLNLCRSIVRAKLKNQLQFMQRISRKPGNKDNLQSKIEQVKNAVTAAEKAVSVESVRGIEGAASRAFFSVFGNAIVPDFAKFKGRSMNPPQDNVNAVMSFVYTMIMNRVDAAIETEGLDPYVGFLHAVEYGKRSLVFDLMEEYRTSIGDTLTVSLFNLGVLQEEDFREVKFSKDNDDFPLEEGEEGEESFNEKTGILLNTQGLRKVITHLEKKLDTEIFYAPLEKRLSYKRIIFQQVRHFKRVIQGEENSYKPLIIK